MRKTYEYISRSNIPEGTDFAVKADGIFAEPYFHDGDTLFVKTVTELSDGDVGVFLIGRDMIVRQYCEDSLGNMYLFALDRKHSELDMTVHTGIDKTVVLFGKVLLKKPIPLPD